MSNEKSAWQLAFEASHPAVILERTTTLIGKGDKQSKTYRHTFAGIVEGSDNNFQEAQQIAAKLNQIRPDSRGAKTSRDYVVAKPSEVNVWNSFADFEDQVVNQAQCEAREKQRAALRKMGAEGRKMFGLPDPDCSDEVLDKLIAQHNNNNNNNNNNNVVPNCERDPMEQIVHDALTEVEENAA